MSSLIPNIRKFITDRQLIVPGEKILAAVSGGIDSMVMLDVLSRLAEEWPFSLTVLHINHGTRGIESDLDERLVRETARRAGLDCTVKTLDGFDETSTEESLRKARYEEFEKALRETGAHKVALGHQLNDQLETFLMRLAKGASLHGLASIPDMRGPYIRPMLAVKRDDIAAYASGQAIPFREDRSNRDEGKLRNRIRHTLFPVLESSLGARFLDGFATSLHNLQSVDASYRNLAGVLFRQMAMVGKNGVTLPAGALLELDSALRKRVVEYCIYSFYKVYSSLENKHFQEFEKFLAHAATGSRFMVSNRVQAEKDRGTVIFLPADERIPERVELFPGKSVCFGRLLITMTEAAREGIVWSPDPAEEFLCGDALELPLTVRCWREGDAFVPLGMKQKQKVSDFFVNNKVPRHRKRHVPLVCSGDDIVWVAGYRLDGRYKVTEQCNVVYRIWIKQVDA